MDARPHPICPVSEKRSDERKDEGTTKLTDGGCAESIGSPATGVSARDRSHPPVFDRVSGQAWQPWIFRPQLETHGESCPVAAAESASGRPGRRCALPSRPGVCVGELASLTQDRRPERQRFRERSLAIVFSSFASSTVGSAPSSRIAVHLPSAREAVTGMTHPNAIFQPRLIRFCGAVPKSLELRDPAAALRKVQVRL